MSADELSASVIVPAHNESVLLPGLLSRLTGMPGLQIIVVCNGCTDDTATIARTFPGVRVLELTESSKVAALNAGDAATDVFPRVYLDADVLIDRRSMQSVVDALASGCLAAAPVPVVATGTSPWAIRRYYAVWTRLGYLRFHTLGSGVYGLSEKGRSRFGLFPELIADDAYVYCQFAADERINPPGAVFTVRPPRTVRALTRRRVRIVAGNLELQAKTGLTIGPPAPGWRGAVRERPRLLASVPVFLGVNLVGAVLARRRARQGTAGSWGQDTTIRSSGQRKRGYSVHTHGLAGAIRRLLSVRGWRQFARVLNFISYDGIARDGIALGADVRMSPTVSVRNGSRIRIGAGSHIGQGSCLWAGNHSGRIDIGDHALLAPNVFITASNYDFDAGPGPVMDLPKRESHVRIGANTWLGANVVVVPGVHIGDGTVVAAGAVVTHDLPPNCVAGGVPARVIRLRGRDETLDGPA